MTMSESPIPSSVSSVRRVLVECDDPAIQDGLERVLRESGYTVSLCGGPASRGSGCPLVVSGQCGLVEDAHVVVHAPDHTDHSNREVLAALVQSAPDTPIVVEAGLVADGESGDARRVWFPMSRAALLDAIHQDALSLPSTSAGPPRESARMLKPHNDRGGGLCRTHGSKRSLTKTA